MHLDHNRYVIPLGYCRLFGNVKINNSHLGLSAIQVNKIPFLWHSLRFGQNYMTCLDPELGVSQTTKLSLASEDLLNTLEFLPKILW